MFYITNTFLFSLRLSNDSYHQNLRNHDNNVFISGFSDQILRYVIHLFSLLANYK